MFLQDQNQMLQILHRKNIKRSHVDKIMTDLEQSGIFDDSYIPRESLDDLNEAADWIFSDASPEEKSSNLKRLEKEKEEERQNKRQNKNEYSLEKEKRILIKIENFVAQGVVKPKKDKGEKVSINDHQNRYGRSPLHEAIAMKDIALVKKYIKEEKYLDLTDNNGHNPQEMAFYENYKEAILLFYIAEENKIAKEYYIAEENKIAKEYYNSR
jgi:hypothetical protein